MRLKHLSKLFPAALIIAGLAVLPAGAAEEHSVNWGDPAYQIIVPGFVEGRTITIDGQEVEAIVVDMPEANSSGRYSFFEIVTTDTSVTLVTSTVSTMEDTLGDFMGEVENGRVTYSPTLYEAFEDIADQPIYMGFSFRNIDFDVVYECPLWIVFEDSGNSASTSAEVKEVTAASNASKVLVNGNQVAFEAYTIEGYNYFKLRDLAMAVTGSGKQFEVTWDGDKNAINLLSDTAYTPVGNELTAGSDSAAVKGVTNQSKIYLDGAVIALDAYTINGNNYFKLRDVAAVFDFGVTWDGTLNQIVIDTSTGYTE